MLRLTITWAHGSSAVLATGNLTINLTAPGQTRAMRPTSQASGRIVFDLDDAHNGRDFTLRILVIYNPGGSASNARGIVPVDMTETLRLQAGSPRLDFHNTSGAWSGRHDPRLSFTSQTIAADGSGTAAMALDVDFLDITATLNGAAPDPNNAQERALDQLHRQSVSHGNRLRILRYSGGVPNLWAAYVASRVPQGATSVGVLVFFTPLHDDPNVEIGDANHRTPLRYLSNRQLPRHFGYVEHDGSGFTWNWNPDCRFMDQIEASEKPIVLLMPYYSASDFGGADGSGLLAMIRSALVCLYSGGPVEVPRPAPTSPAPANSGAPGAQADDPVFEIQRFLGRSATGTTMSIRRLAVAGFSAGGASATWAWERNKGSISEVYLMDPSTEHYSVTSYTAGFDAWLQGQNRDRVGLISSDERLCMIGGDYLGACLQVAAGVTGNVHVRPASEDFYYTAREYIAAFATNTTSAATASPSPQLLSDVGSAVSPLSARTGIQIDRATCSGRHLSITAPGIHGVRPTQIVDHAPIELAAFVGFARGWYTNGRTDPLSRSSDFSTLLHNIQHNYDEQHDPRAVGAPGGYARRHQWPSFGGEDVNNQFTGYLRICLQRSAF